MALLKQLSISALVALAVLVAAALVLGGLAPLLAPATAWWLGLGLVLASIAVFAVMAIRRIRMLEREHSGAPSAGHVLLSAAMLFVFGTILSSIYSGAARALRLDEALGGARIDVSAAVLVVGIAISLLGALAYAGLRLRHRDRSGAG